MLVLVGDFETKTLLRKIEDYFGEIEGAESPPEGQIVEPPQNGERRVTLRRKGTTAHLQVTYHIPSVKDDDFYP